MSHTTWIASLTLVGGLILAFTFTSFAKPTDDQAGAAKESSRVDVEVTVNAPLVEVWRTWTTSAGAEEFFAPKCEIELFPGGSYNILFMPDNPPGQRGAEGRKVLSYLPMEMLSFDWDAPPKFPFARAHPGWVVIQFKAVDDAHTHVRLVHTGFDELKARHPEHADEFDQTHEYFSQAWPLVMSWLEKRFIEGPRWDHDGNERWAQ